MSNYLLSVYGAADQPMPEPEVMQATFEAVDAFNADLQAAGVWVFADGLEPPDTATVVDATTGGDVVLTDGPYVETKEHLGGFWIIDVADLDVAIEWATKASTACANPVEVRPMQPLPDDA
jgi:hypothetical protein